MNITQHGNYLTKVTRMRFVNAYFVREDDGLTLIDTHLGGSAKGLVEAAQTLGFPIKRMILTHAHSDHIGSADGVHKLVPDAEVLVSARTARILGGDFSVDPDEPQTKLKGGVQAIKTKPDRLLEEGDMVGSLQVVFSPGHIPGHIALLDVRDQTLIAGDAYVNMSGLSVTGVFRLLFPFTAFATWHKPTALASARKLRALIPERLAVGHGAVIEKPAAEMDKAIAEAEKAFA